MFRTCSPKDFKSSLNGLLFSDLNMIKSEYDKIRTFITCVYVRFSNFHIEVKSSVIGNKI